MKLLVVLCLVVGCTKPNPAVCCLDEADCAAAGIPNGRTCAEGLICLAHQCEVPEQGVDCTDDTQCAASAPVCELSTNQCRVCRSDSECATGVCLDNGTCAPETDSVYVSPTGQNGDCTLAAPCATLAYAVGKLTATRFRLVFQPGTYMPNPADGAPIAIADIGTRVYLHGHGARVSVVVNWPNAAVVSTSSALAVRELEIVRNPGSSAIVDAFNSDVRLERVTLRGGGISVAGPNTSALEIMGALIVPQGAAIVFSSDGLRPLTVASMIVYGGQPLTLPSQASGTISSSTIAWTGSSSGSGPQAFICPATGNVTIKNSILWTPSAGSLPPIGGGNCPLQNVIAGPVQVAGATNIDPQFMDGAAGDCHLKPTSPARDAADEGPVIDFDGDARPQGVRFDIGGDEVVVP